MMCQEVKEQKEHYPRAFDNLFLADILVPKQLAIKIYKACNVSQNGIAL